MNPKFDRRLLPLILTSLVVLGLIPACVCQNDQLYQTCSQPFECGSSTEIGYPFYGGNRPVSCGYPGFELSCQDGVTLLNTSSMIYRVLAIDNQTQTLRVSRDDLWDNLCPESPSNTTLDFSLFDFYPLANDHNFTLYYDCTFFGQRPPIFAPNYEFGCRGSNPSSSNFFIASEVIGQQNSLNITCSTHIFVRVNESASRDLSNPTSASAPLLQASLQGGFSIEWSANNQDCNDCARSGGLCGYNLTSSSFACHCSDGTTASICNGSRTGNAGSKEGLSDQQIYLILGLSLGMAGLVVSTIIIYYITRKYKLHDRGQENNQNVNKFLLNHGSLAPKRYSYNDIKKITKSFTDELGQGGYGIVYKGELPDGQLVAVKVLIETVDNTEEFINEVASISRTSHVNIVNLLGFCYDRKKRALVYEFMPNKSLDKFIDKSGSADSECPLQLEKLYEIAVGVARGLEYLHRGCNTRIVHFDIKPQNILLDEEFCPKISDFGLAKLLKKKQSIISMLGTRGTIGYIAPEVFSRSFGVVSHKSDVYSYGMMLLEMAEARKFVETEGTQSSENYFPDRVYEHLLLQNETLGALMTEEREETTRKMLLVGFWCIQTAPSDRPPMSKVVEMLEGSLQSIQIPPKPFLSYPKLSVSQFSSSFSVDVQTENTTEG